MKRAAMNDMIDEGNAELEEMSGVDASGGDGAAPSLPYTVTLAMRLRAVLVTNQKHARLASAYRLREQRDALVVWTRQWVWPFAISREGEIVPSANFATPEPGAEAVFDVLEAVVPDTVRGFFDKAARSQLEMDELPGTAVRRRAALDELVHFMISLASPSDLGGISADSFIMKKAAWDVVNKWVYRRDSRHHRHARAPISLENASRPRAVHRSKLPLTGRGGDPLIPTADERICDWLAEQLWVAFEPNISRNDAARGAVDLVAKSARRAVHVWIGL